MTFSSEFIDEVVRNVMRELNLPSTSAPAAPPTSAGSVEIPHRVITEDVLSDHSAPGTTVMLPDGAVITPSGRDYIRRHRLVVNSVSANAAAPSGGGMVLTVGDMPGLSAAARSAGWTVSAAAGNFDAANQVAQQSDGRRTVCCSSQPSVIACLINRNTGRRAAVLTTETCLTELMDEMNPDTVCLSSVGWSFGQLMRVLRQLHTHPSAIPQCWKELA